MKACRLFKWEATVLALAVTLVVATRAQGPVTLQSSSQTVASNDQPGTHWTEAQIKKAVAPARAGRKLVPKSWPNGARVAVSIGFDVDNESPLLNRNNLQPVALSETEYGATTGMPRILALLDREGIPATFFCPAVSLMLAPEMIPAIQKSGRHEIALHSWIHESWPDLNDAAEEQRLMTQSIDYLTKATGKRPVGVRSGGWSFSPYSLDIIRKAGLLYDSSMMARDEPYNIMSSGQDTGILELPVSWIEDDAPYFGRTGALPSPELIFRVYQDEFDVAYREGTLCMLTFHPHVSGHRSRIAQMEKLFAYIKSKPGVWFGTAQQVAEYVKQNASAR